VVCRRIRSDESARPRGEAGSFLHKLGYLVVVVVFAASVLAYRGIISSSSHPRPSANPPREAPGLNLPRLSGPSNVLAAAADPTPLSAAKVRARLGSLLRDKSLGRHYALAVGDLTGPAAVVAGHPGVVTPASTMKLLTTTAALRVLGPDHRFGTTTRFVPHSREVVLVGGGDPMLSNGTKSPLTSYPRAASLNALAVMTANGLRARHVDRVRLGYDSTLFTGPASNPHWEPSYVKESVVTPTGALWVDQGRRKPYFGLREQDPAAVAASVFAARLAARGIKVVGDPRAVKVPPTSGHLAAVESAPLKQLVDFILETSNNEGAEVLLRHIAIAGHSSGSALNGVIIERSALARLGVPLAGARIYDGSGLSRADRLPVATLVKVLQLASSPAHPELRGVITGLPIAGFSGTLASRFRQGAGAAVGLVRVKTGTLAGVTAYAGTITTRVGTPLIFAVAADRVANTQTLAARATLDKIAARLATCGCNA
jgi:D-alanyl-D-alanine carboxypeptidase/D-alanyl-D-alanine-endopeptidase (penicillin-binding protein 4)